jgi:hypothetical protein
MSTIEDKFELKQLLEEDFSKRDELTLEFKGREITFELREPTMHEMKIIRKKYVRLNQSGMDVGKSNLDELNYATVAAILYYGGEPAFPSGVSEAAEFIERLPVSIGNKIIGACREICGDENSDEAIEELEKN